MVHHEQGITIHLTKAGQGAQPIPKENGQADAAHQGQSPYPQGNFANHPQHLRCSWCIHSLGFSFDKDVLLTSLDELTVSAHELTHELTAA